MKLLTGIIILIVLLGARVLVSGQTEPGVSPDQNADGAVDASTQADATSSAPEVSAPKTRSSFLYGISLLQGVYEVSADVRSTEYILATRPFVGIDFRKDRYRIHLESSPIITYVPSHEAAFGVNGFIDPHLLMTFDLSRKWSLTLNTGIQYGYQILEFMDLAGRPSEIQLPSPNTAVVQSGRIFDLHGDGVLSWRRTRTQILSFRTGGAYSNISGGYSSTASSDLNSNYAYARTELVQTVKQQSVFTVYGQVHNVHWNSYACSSIGTGFGVHTPLTKKSNWGVEVGPEYGVQGCTTTWLLNLAGWFQWRIDAKSNLSLNAGRDLNAYYLPGHRWADTASAGYHRKISTSTMGDLVAGYVHGSGDGIGGTAYSGFMIGPEFIWKVRPRLDLFATYRHFTNSYTTSSLVNRNFVTFGITWKPVPVKL